MFASLSERFNGVFKNLSGRGRISESNVAEAMGEVRTALLEADVHFDVVKTFCDSVLEDAVGAQVTHDILSSDSCCTYRGFTRRPGKHVPCVAVLFQHPVA